MIFDVDGTLVDSQVSILAAMRAAFEGIGHPVPPRAEVLGIVGLSLDRAMAQLAPDLTARDHDRLVEGYRTAFVAQRTRHGADFVPFYTGAEEVLDVLYKQPETLLGIATGKSRRGLDALLSARGLQKMFVTCQVADHHPSKPHPSMIHAALAETGVAPEQAVMIGDTRFDMDMARAAGIASVGVSWGYHPAETLNASHGVIDSFDHLPARLDDIWRQVA